MASSVQSVSFELGALAGVTVRGTILTAVYTSTIRLPATAPARAAGCIDAARAAAGRLPASQARTLLDAAVGVKHAVRGENPPGAAGHLRCLRDRSGRV
jgi:MFS transporter, DHA2 family, multidrug resistance protein